MLVIAHSKKDDADLVWNLVVQEAVASGRATLQKGSKSSVTINDAEITLRNARVRAVLPHMSTTLQLAQILQWQSVADSMNFDADLETHLATRAFLTASFDATVADFDLALKTQAETPNVQRWKRTVLHQLQQRAQNVGLETNLKAPASTAPVWWFATGEEDLEATLTEIHTVKEQPAAAKKQKQQEKKPEKKEKPKKAAPPPANDDLDITALDLRVGQIVKIWPHPESDKLYCEDVDMGNGEVRQVASGLRLVYPDSNELLNKQVVVVANLKKRNLVGFPSHGMVLCATSEKDGTKQVEIIQPPEGTALGERLVFGNLQGEAQPENKVAKKKMFEKLAPDLQTNGEGAVVWKDAVATTSAGMVFAINKMPNAQVS